MIAAMGLDEASNKWSTLTGTLEFLDETTTQKSIKTDGMKTLKGDIPSDLAGRQPENIASDSVPQTSPAGPQPSKAQPENTVVRADKPDDYIKPPDSHKRVQLLCICEDSLTNKSENFVFQFSADLRQAVFGYQNGTVELYNIPEQRLVSRFAIHLVITSITMDPFNERIACGHQSMRFTVWDYHGNSLIHKGDVTTEPVTAISFVREVHWLGGPGVLTFTKSALPSIWDERRATTQSSQSFTFIQADTTKRDPSLDCVAISQDTNFLAIFMPMYEDSGIAIIDLRKDEVVSLTPLPPNWNKFTVIFSWDGSLLAYTGSSSIIVWDIVLKRIVHEISADGYQYLDLAFSHDGLLLAGSWTRKAKSGIHLWDCITGERKLCILDACVRCIAFSGDDSLIGVGSPPSRGVRGWNVRGIYRIASTADIESFAKKKSFEDRAGSPRAMGNKLTKPGGRHLDDEVCSRIFVTLSWILTIYRPLR
jgi:WD40 repeat protein